MEGNRLIAETIRKFIETIWFKQLWKPTCPELCSQQVGKPHCKFQSKGPPEPGKADVSVHVQRQRKAILSV